MIYTQWESAASATFAGTTQWGTSTSTVDISKLSDQKTETGILTQSLHFNKIVNLLNYIHNVHLSVRR